MGAVTFHVRGWKSWPLSSSEEKTGGIPSLLRRRITPIGQKALAATWELPKAADARLVLSSRHGEFARTMSLMEAAVAREELSPADFTLSVHHALAGLLSIVHGNRRGHIAVASGTESFCFGLLEAAGCLNENPNEPVMLIHFDEPLPGAFAAFNEPDERPIALALSLAASGEGVAIHIEMQPTSSAEQASSHAQDFLDFLESGAGEGVSASGDRLWRWARHGLA